MCGKKHHRELVSIIRVKRGGARGEFSPVLSLPGGGQELYCTVFLDGEEVCRGRAELEGGLVRRVEFW